MLDFVHELALMDSDTAADHSRQTSKIASYIDDESGSAHPWVEVSRWDGKKEAGTTQMRLTVRDPSIMERESVEAEPPFNAEDGGV